MSMHVADPEDPFALSLVEQVECELEGRGVEVKPHTSFADMVKLLEESNEELELPELSAPYYTTEPASTKKARRTVAVKSALQRRQLRSQRRGRNP